MKTKKFNEFVNMKVGLDLVNYDEQHQVKTIDLSKYNNKSKSAEELKKAAETIGLDLTKNLSNHSSASKTTKKS